MASRPKGKRKSEHPRHLLTRTLQGWQPATAYDSEQMMHYPIGATVEAQFWQERSLEHLRLYWVVLHGIVANSEQWPRAEDLHEAIKIDLGYTREIKLLGLGPIARFQKVLLEKLRAILPMIDAKPLWPVKAALVLIVEFVKNADEMKYDTVLMPGSIAIDKMDQAEFRKFFDGAMNSLRRAGYDPDAFLKEGKKQLAPVRAPSLPYHSEKRNEQSDRTQNHR